MLADYHLHSHFSGDCSVPMSDMIQKAIDLNIKLLCFTDHFDIDYPSTEIDFTLDVDQYLTHIEKMQEQYAGRIQILKGIELGLQMHLHPLLTEIVTTHDFDFVIGSQHLANGEDVYEPEFYANRSQSEGYLTYFQDLYDNAKGFDEYDVYGHLDYVVRYGRAEQKALIYKDFKEIIDAILKIIIQKGKGIEINTAGYKYNIDGPNPHPDVLNRYRELGGEIITIGSDAHMPNNILSDFDRAKVLLKSLGYPYFTTFQKRKPEFHKL